MEKKVAGFGPILAGITVVTTIVYAVIAIVLAALAVLSFVQVFTEMLAIFQAGGGTIAIIGVLHALLVTIIILELLETVTIYFRTSRIPVRPLLVAGLTAMIRRVLVFGVEPVNPVDIFATVAVIATLTVAVIYIGKEEESETGKE
jgi:uncharacterized membrane protein (DUF373 family)